MVCGIVAKWEWACRVCLSRLFAVYLNIWYLIEMDWKMDSSVTDTDSCQLHRNRSLKLWWDCGMKMAEFSNIPLFLIEELEKKKYYIVGKTTGMHTYVLRTRTYDSGWARTGSVYGGFVVIKVSNLCGRRLRSAIEYRNYVIRQDCFALIIKVLIYGATNRHSKVKCKYRSTASHLFRQ